ncbi:MAG: GGDEF domain-containing protein [Actinomycetes bacterium]
MDRAKTYLTLRIFAVGLLVFHMAFRILFHGPDIFSELFLYNFIAFLAAFIVLGAPRFNDHFATKSIALAFALWAVGSSISSFNSFFTWKIPSLLVDVCYSTFYPLLLFGLVRTLVLKLAVTKIEIIDTLIVVIGISAISAGLVMKPAMAHFDGSTATVFLSVVYPICDVALIAMTVALLVRHKLHLRSSLLLVGIAAFAVTDFIFFWLSATSEYSFASLVDDGWLVGLLFISESLFHQGEEYEVSQRISAALSFLALWFSLASIAISVLSPKFLPHVVVLPCLVTIALVFLKMEFRITMVRESHEERRLARTDELTGLPNRRRFIQELEKLNRRDGSLLLLDLDGFKEVNDRYGHEVGDQLLKHIAIRFSRFLPADVLLARLGGDEFAIVVVGEKGESLELAQAIRASLTYPFNLPSATVSVGVSVGVANNEGEQLTPEALLRRADAAMYEAKRSGLGVVVWFPSLDLVKSR